MKSILNATPKTSNQVATVVFIDAGVENYQQLVNGVIPTAEVFVLDAAADGIEQISQVLQQRQDVGAVHLVSHGAPGCLYLGNTQLSLDTFNRYATQLQTWNAPNLLLYGCNVAAGDAGEEFITKLHQLTGANIAASTTPVGNSALGGNWELEVVLGQEQPLLVFSPSVMAAYEGILNRGTPPTLSVSGTTQYNGSPVAVAPLLTITDPNVRDTLDGATVALNGLVTAQESLGIAGQANGSISGISWEYDPESGVLTLTGTAAVSTYQSVLRQVTYQNTSATPTTAPRDIQFTLGTLLYNSDNGHYYDFIEAPNITWTEARDAADDSTYLGLQGYLATITSANENDLVASKLQGQGWIGASDAANEDVWRWVTGPEAGTQFWQGNGPNAGGTPVNGQYSNWSPVYNNRPSDEPNNDNSQGEDYAHFLTNPLGQWNDYPNTVLESSDIIPIAGYVVEYGGMPGDASPLQITGTATVTFNQAPPVPTQTSNWDFVTRDYNINGATDIVAIKKSDTGSGTTEVHIMDADTNYQTWLLQTPTVLHETDDTWDFVGGDYDNDGNSDIFAIKKSETGSGTTEIHIMNAATNYQTWLLQTETPLHETDDTWDFVAGDYNVDGNIDIICIKKSETGSRTTEIHILDGATNYQTWLLHTGTALHETDDTFDFQVGDYDGDGNIDIIGIKKSETGSRTTEVHVLNGANNYQNYLLQTPTLLHETDDTFAFLMDDYNSANPNGIISVKESYTGTGQVEAHILNADNNYLITGTDYDTRWLLQTPTVLQEITPSSVV